MGSYDKYLFRCSGLGDIMGFPEAGKMSVGAQTACKIIHREMRWHRHEQIHSKYLTKGTEREEDAITLLSRVEGMLMKKNAERLSNAYITGEPDLYQGESIRNCTRGWDTKCAYTWKTFPIDSSKIDSGYVWQGQGYMALTGAEQWTVSYCLVNSSTTTIDDEKRKKKYALNAFDDNDPAYIAACKEIEKDHIYDIAAFKNEYPHYDMAIPISDWNYNIPMAERVLSMTFARDESKIIQIYNRVALCREYLNTLP